jgi:hypothetical protein
MNYGIATGRLQDRQGSMEMKVMHRLLLGFSLSVLLLCPAAAAQAAAAPHDGQRDFDFEFGSWKTHIDRLPHPLSGEPVDGARWIGMDGTSVVRRVWDGRANLGELEVGNADAQIEGLSLRSYNRKSGQWSIYWANSREGTLGTAMVGGFKSGRGEFYGPDTLGDKAIFVRFIFSDITARTFKLEQAFSDDGGKSWETNWRASFVKESDSGAPAPAVTREVERDRQHDFDFNLGVWNSHITRAMNPLSAASDAFEMNGTVTVRKIWDGRALLEEIEADGPKGHWEGMTLFLYNPQSRQWNQSFIGADAGALSGSLAGEFKGGVGELYAADTLNGRAILVRGTWSQIKTDSHHYEEAYSDDGGRSWHPAFDADLTRARS